MQNLLHLEVILISYHLSGLLIMMRFIFAKSCVWENSPRERHEIQLNL